MFNQNWLTVKYLQLALHYMYMKKIYLLFIFNLLTFYSCTNKNNTFSNKDFFLTEKKLPLLQQVSFSKVSLPKEEYYDALFYVYHDSILIVNKTSQLDTYCIELVNLNNGNAIGKYLRRGNGPNEVLNLIVLNYQNRLNITDIQKEQVIIFNIDSAICARNNYKPIIKKMNNFFFRHDILTDSSIIIYNPWHLSNCGNLANEKIPELEIINLNDLNYKIPKDALYTANEADAFVVSNIKKNRLFLAYRKYPLFSFLDFDLDTIKIIKGPETIKRKNYKYKILEGEICNKIRNTYSSFTYSTDNYLFVCTNRICGFYPKSIEEHKRIINNNKPELFKFDWDGNLIARYQMPKNFVNLSFSEDSNTLYMTAKDENDELCLYKAQL